MDASLIVRPPPAAPRANAIRGPAPAQPVAGFASDADHAVESVDERERRKRRDQPTSSPSSALLAADPDALIVDPASLDVLFQDRQHEGTQPAAGAQSACQAYRRPAAAAAVSAQPGEPHADLKA